MSAWLWINLGGLKTVTWKFLSFYNFPCYQPCIALQEAWLRATLVSKHWSQRPPIGSWASWVYSIIQDTANASPVYHLENPPNPVASVCKAFPWRSTSSKRVHRHCNTKHRDKAHNTENEDRRSCTHVQKTTNRFKSSSQDNNFQRVPNCLTTVPQTSTNVQVQFKLHGQQFQNNWQHTEQQTCYDPQLLGYLMWQVVISIPLQLHHWIIRVP